MCNDKSVYIIGGLRTQIGKTNGILKHILPEKLTAHLISGILDKYKISKENIEEVIVGNVIGPGGNIARLSLLEAGLLFSTVGTTIDFQCGSSLKAINMAANMIRAGERDLVIAGGTESTSLAPKKQYNRNDFRYRGEDIFFKRAQFSPYYIGDPDMIEGAEYTANYCNITREEMDILAVESHGKAIKARDEKKLLNIIYPYMGIPKEDESIRNNVSIELMRKAKPILKAGSKITSANACLTHDGAALVLLASKEAVKKYNLKVEAELVYGASTGISPMLSPLGATFAIEEILNSRKLNIKDIDLVEINEAFAVKIIAFLKHFNYQRQKVNVYGGALAYGHPYGASGAVIILHLIEALKDKNKKRGIAAMGVGGGLGVATMIERCD